MAHKVKCAICGAVFDRDTTQAVRVGSRRYAHANCDPSNSDFVPLAENKEDADLAALKLYIEMLYGKSANWGLISKQIKEYVSKGYTYSGIQKTLQYFYEVKKNSVDNNNGGIGIVGFQYKQAHDYYYSLWLARQKNEYKKPEDYIPNVIEVEIENPERKIRKRPLFTFLDEES